MPGVLEGGAIEQKKPTGIRGNIQNSFQLGVVAQAKHRPLVAKDGQAVEPHHAPCGSKSLCHNPKFIQENKFCFSGSEVSKWKDVYGSVIVNHFIWVLLYNNFIQSTAEQ